MEMRILWEWESFHQGASRGIVEQIGELVEEVVDDADTGEEPEDVVIACGKWLEKEGRVCGARRLAM